MSPQQLDLLSMPVDPLPVRSSDPATSRVSARMLPIKERKREVLAAMERLSGTVTAGQIQADLARNGIARERGTVASRLSQLERDGLVAKVGVTDGDQGRPVITWRLA
jgi:predicted ArsR family transcriptional regulator